MSDPSLQKPLDDAKSIPSKSPEDTIIGEVYDVVDHGADSGLKRQLGSRHISMIGLASSIGMGLWLGSGTSLKNAGPAGIFLGYLLSGTIIWSVSHSIGEMAIMYPLPSAVSYIFSL
jgi:amino acid transporter